MTAATARSTGPVPRHALRRGTRGFAAVVLFLTGMAVLAIAFFVLPSTAIDGAMLTVLVPLGIVFGVAHLVAVYGVVRRRAWVVPLSLYLLAIGLGVGAFVALLLRAGIDPLLPAGMVAVEGTAAGTFGLVVWLAGSWLVAARFVVRGMAAPEGRASTDAVPARGSVAPQPAIRPARIGRGVFTFGAYSS
jgi:hypothetical protein